jgi:hypothetical protein
MNETINIVCCRTIHPDDWMFAGCVNGMADYLVVGVCRAAVVHAAPTASPTEQARRPLADFAFGLAMRNFVSLSRACDLIWRRGGECDCMDRGIAGAGAREVRNCRTSTLKARHATGKWRLLMPATTRVDGRNEARWLLGAYDNRYVCDNGVWLFEVMNLHVNLFAPHRGSWADAAVQ